MKNPIVLLSILAGVAFILTADVPLSHPYYAYMDRLEKQAIDRAFRHHMENLFAVYMREPDKDPAKPIAGAEKLRKAYVLIREAIDKRAAERGRRP